MNTTPAISDTREPEVSTACLEDTHSGPTILPWVNWLSDPCLIQRETHPACYKDEEGPYGPPAQAGQYKMNESQLTLLLSKSDMCLCVSSVSLTISAGLWGEKTPHAGFSQSTSSRSFQATKSG